MRRLPALLALAGQALMPAQAAGPAEWVYRVTPGDTLSGIADAQLDKAAAWKALQQLNQVAEPRQLRANSDLRIPVTPGSRAEVFAEVVWVRGDAQSLPALAEGGSAKPALPQALMPGMQLRRGDVVRTGPASSVTLRFADQSRLMLSANSRVAITQMLRNPQTGQVSTETALQAGSAESTVVRREKAEVHYRVKTPSLNLAVRGTVFQVTVDPATGQAHATVTEGLVSASAQQQQVSVSAGSATSAAPGQAPRPPTALSAAPRLIAPAASVAGWPAYFAWSADAQARQFQLELLSEDGSAQLDYRRLPAPQVDLTDLQDGRYRLRVRALDDAGLAGQAAVFAFEVRQRPAPPLLRQPLAGAVVGPASAFRWAQRPDARHYHFQVSSTPDFRQPVVEAARLHPGSAGIEDVVLPPGHYFWRVAAATGDGGPDPFSDAQAFEVRAAPPPAAVEGNAVTLRWQAGHAGLRYQVQTALSADFALLESDQVVAAPQVRLTVASPAPRYVRLRRITDQGVAGPFEATQQFSLGAAN